MLKRVRSKSDSRAGIRKILSSLMINNIAHSGDRKRTCAFTAEACQIMNDLRKKNLLCDARIAAKKDDINECAEFPVHRFILAGMFKDKNPSAQIIFIHLNFSIESIFSNGFCQYATR